MYKPQYRVIGTNRAVFLHTSDIIGGAEKSLIEFLVGTDKQKQISLAIPFDSGFYSKIEHLLIEKYNFCFNCLDKRKRPVSIFLNYIRCSFSLYRFIVKEKIDIIYCNTFKTIPFCVFIKLFTRKRIICHCRDNLRNKIIHMLVTTLSDEIIGVSEYLLMQLHTKKALHLVYNGTSQLTDYGFSESLREKYNLSSDTLLIANIGQILEWKNQKDFILIAEQLLIKKKNLHFFCVGPVVDTAYYRSLLDMVKRKKMESYFTFTGFVEKIDAYLSDFSIILHTAIGEPFGRVLIEAAAAGTPVVAYRSGGIKEIIIHEKTGFLVEPYSISEMTKQAIELLHNEKLYNKIIKTAYDYVLKRFNSRVYVESMNQIIWHCK